MSRTTRTNYCEEQAALRRSVRQRDKQEQGEVPDSGVDNSSDSEIRRYQRDSRSAETSVDIEVTRPYLEAGNRMSRKDGDRDSGRGS